MQRVNSATRYRAPRSASLGGLLLFALLPLDRALAFQAVTLDAGYGMGHTRLLRFNFSLGDDSRRIPANYGWSWHQSWEGNLSYWYLYKFKEGEKDMFELGLTPNFRLERDRVWEWGRPYLEAGLGVHLISKVHIGHRNLGSALQFGSHAGLGLRFGCDEQWDVAWRIEHLSNGGLKEPNTGINFTMIRIGYRW